MPYGTASAGPETMGCPGPDRGRSLELPRNALAAELCIGERIGLVHVRCNGKSVRGFLAGAAACVGKGVAAYYNVDYLMP